MSSCIIWPQKTTRMFKKKTEVWEEIGSLVNLSGEACRKRWKGLRDTYKRRKRAAQLASGSGAPSPSKRWRYMESLEFLDDYKDARTTIGNIDNIDNDLPSILDCSSSSVNDFLLTDESSSQANEPPPKYTKKHADAEITTVFKQVMQECANSVREIASGSEISRNSTLLLFESLAQKLIESNLPQVTMSEIEAKVVSLVYKEIAQNIP
ncbi:uncharacterized protein LOC131800455 [Musca domestica]|uniref:Uncharacterized protein LOC131800455 n=1 Tax=Musca domestica TaxID=7370 RepID=A0ABM3V5K7_MUSDO|nr:uncharacterized protein LOC131800455 [Musca domestica]